MALEVQVHDEIRAYEAKIIGPLSWRQLLCLLVAAPLLAGVSFALWHIDRRWITYVDLLVFAPFAAYGWWRPRNLKPEVFARYIASHIFGSKVLRHEIFLSKDQEPRRSRRHHDVVTRRLEHGDLTAHRRPRGAHAARKP